MHAPRTAEWYQRDTHKFSSLSGPSMSCASTNTSQMRNGSTRDLTLTSSGKAADVIRHLKSVRGLSDIWRAVVSTQTRGGCRSGHCGIRQWRRLKSQSENPRWRIRQHGGIQRCPEWCPLCDSLSVAELCSQLHPLLGNTGFSDSVPLMLLLRATVLRRAF